MGSFPWDPHFTDPPMSDNVRQNLLNVQTKGNDYVSVKLRQNYAGH